MILILLPLAAALLGVALWAAMRGLGAFNVLGVEPGQPSHSYARERTPTNMRERIGGMPRGCLLSVIVASGVWILGWLVVLVVGLSLLS